MTIALCPGSFDPPTNGHVDVIRRALAIFDEVVVGVIGNPSKNSMFSSEERVHLLQEVFRDVDRVSVESFDGLLVEYAGRRHVDVIVKGLRGVADFDSELQMAQMNHHLSGIETCFVATNPSHGYISSSLVKEVARLGGSTDRLVPAEVQQALDAKGSR
ncbi:MAG: pantetheine-phosphate adenylyltransferase [Acidimicrobiia bacterium]|nr:pantetheine-phosphate adenylyltransferase [Acidimicrobiia bacterium]